MGYRFEEGLDILGQKAIHELNLYPVTCKEERQSNLRIVSKVAIMKRMTILSTAVIFLMFINQTLFSQSEFSVSKKSTSDTLLIIKDDD